jgi:branched-chain amino acid transport system permease protein
MFLIALLGMAAQKAFFAPLTGKPVATLAMSFGLLLALQGAAFALFGGKEKMIHTPLSGILTFPGGVTTTYHNLLIIGITAILVASLYYFIFKTKAGQAMRALEQDMDTAALMGIESSKINLLAFGIGCGLAGIAGLLIGAVFPIEPIMGGGILLKAFAIIIVGGIGSLSGAIVASFIWTFAELFAGFAIGGDLAFIVCFAAVFLILVFKPTGLFGHEVS